MSHKNRLYPHLLPKDIEVWERWLDKHRQEYTHFDYDLRVGEGRDPGLDFDPKIRKMALDLSQRRIDAVGYQPNRIKIIEITTAIGHRAIGQYHVYPTLYIRKFQPSLPVDCLIVGNFIEPDIVPVLIERGIKYEII